MTLRLPVVAVTARTSAPNNLMVYSRFLGFAAHEGDYRQMRQTVPDAELVDRSKRRIDQLGFIGLTEHFDDSYRRLEGWLGMAPGTAVPRINVDPAPRAMPGNDVSERVREVAWMDVEIYEYARLVAANRA